MTILFIGCGNPLRRDDGLGPALARWIGRRWRRSDVVAIACHQLTPELAPRLAGPAVVAVIFADAATSDHPPDPLGALLQPLDERPFAPSLGHHFGPAALLNLTVRLYGRRPPAWLLPIPGEDFGLGRGFSVPARRSLHRAAEEMSRFLNANA